MFWSFLILSCSTLEFNNFIGHWWQFEEKPEELQNIECFVFYQIGEVSAGDFYIYNTHGYLEGPTHWFQAGSNKIELENFGNITTKQINDYEYKITFHYNVFKYSTNVNSCETYYEEEL